MTKLIIPGAALEQHTAILGKTGSGKTSTAKLAIEQVVASGARVCVLDPIKSDWWGLTSSADGKKPGLPFHILGGPRGHVPLHASAGKAIGEVVASGALPLSIIDMADFAPGGQAHFFVDFAPTLIRRMRGVVYLVIEEAHLFAPKERAGVGAENMSIHWAKTLATAGRSKGIRLLLLTQRVQALHNALLGSCETLIAHRLSAPADQDPVLKWLKANASSGILEMVSAQLSSLKTGAAWVCSGEAKIFERMEFPRIKTFDNTATPTGDGDLQDVKQAPVDTDKLRSIVGEAVKEAEASDPKLLRVRISELERELKKGHAPEVDLVSIAAARQEGRDEGAHEGYAAGLRAMHPFMERLATLTAALSEHVDGYHADLQKLTGKAAVHQTTVSRPTPPRPQAPLPRTGAPSADISGPLQRVLDALAELEQLGVGEPERVQVAFLAGYSNLSSKGFANALGTARTGGLIDYPNAGRIALTDAGRAIARAPDRPASTKELHARLLTLLGGQHARVLQPLIDAYPDALEREDLASKAGYTNLSSKGFANAIGRLRSLGFIDYPQSGHVAAQPVLFING